ncbi:sensor histidine kinase [Paenibacillus cymbidii]|uniref:sensor histidine kinase n=1 Tax=Paenibacillus cymbidii TaxID=1639034 RepID=UPI0014368E25|nr:sensor histidine kinase [Paenibacillus cymbidii]
MGTIRYAAIILIGLFIWCFAAPSSWGATHVISAPDERMDLSQWHPLEDGIITLDGPWEFYWKQLLEPADFADSHISEKAVIVTLPAQWKSYRINGQPLSNEGFATYRLAFPLSGAAAAGPLGLYINNIASAYKIWINGEPMKGNGTVGNDRTRMVPRSYPQVVFFLPSSGDNEIVIQVSNDVQRTGGIWEQIELGDAGDISAQHRNRVMVWTFITGCLLLMTVFSVFLYLFRKQERAALWFGLICLAICIRSSLLGESYVYVLFPELSWEWGVKLEYLSEIVTIISLAAFVNKQYPRDAIRRLFPIFAVALSAFAILVLATPAIVYTKLMVPYIIVLLLPVFVYVMYIYVRAALRRRMGSRINMIGFSGFFLAVIHEVLYYTGFLPFGGLVSFGLLFFLLTQLMNLSSAFTKAMTESESLTSQLQQVIASQEETIKERTSSLQQLNDRLEQGNRELIRIENVRSALLAEVYHDLSTPITAIKGFSKAIHTAVIAEEEAPLYASRIYERSLMLEKLIDNVVELSQLKTGEVQFQFVATPLVPFVRQLSFRYATEAAASGIALHWVEPAIPLPPGKELLVVIDRLRFERVMDNLVANAVKYSPVGGSIRIGMQFRPEPQANRGQAAIYVADSGIGIPEAELPHIFKRRYRIQGTDQSRSGSGLGLAICSEIVARHHGELSVSSRLGEGSEFTVLLPAAVGELAKGDEHEHVHTAH